MCENICGPYYYNSSFKLWLATSQIPKAGIGVYTREFIPAGSIIDEYTGEVISHKRPSAYSLEVRTDCYIDAQALPRCYMAMINDCSYIAPTRKRRRKRWVYTTPDAYYDSKGNRLMINCQFIADESTGRAYISALVDIPEGAELFVEYGPDYWACH